MLFSDIGRLVLEQKHAWGENSKILLNTRLGGGKGGGGRYVIESIKWRSYHNLEVTAWFICTDSGLKQPVFVGIFNC